MFGLCFVTLCYVFAMFCYVFARLLLGCAMFLLCFANICAFLIQHVECTGQLKILEVQYARTKNIAKHSKNIAKHSIT